MKLVVLLFTLIFSTALAAPTLQHILGIKEAVRDYIHGVGGGHNHEHGYGRGYGHPHGHGHAGYGLGSGKNENSHVVYIQNGEKQQHGYTNDGAEHDFNGYGSSHFGPYVGRPVGQHVGMHAQRPHYGTAQSTANAISSSWSHSAAGSPGFHHGNGGGASAAASSSSNADFI